MHFLKMAMIVAGVAVGVWVEAEARVKLITLPARERVELRLDREGATLVEEERVVPLVTGSNQVDFSWVNTRIDPESIVFRVVGGEVGEAEVLSVSYPPGEQALVWTVHAPRSGSARVRIAYVLGGVGRSFSYRARASADERELTLSRYIQIKNSANEAFEQTGIWIADGTHISRPLGRAETREVLLDRWTKVPVRKTYSVDLVGQGWLNQAKSELKVAMHYVLANDPEHGLGEKVLPRGKARLFQADRRGGVVFLGEDWVEHTPPGAEATLFLGLARDVVVKRTIEANERQRIDGDLFEQSLTIKFEIENFKSEALTLAVNENLARIRARALSRASRPVQWRLGPQSDFPGGADPEYTHGQQLRVHTSVPAASSDTAPGRIVRRLQIIFANEW